MSKLNQISSAITRSPFLWGALASLALYAAIHTGAVQGEFVARYFAGHPVMYVETTVFFVGLAALLLKAGDLWQQFRWLPDTTLGPLLPGGQTPDDAGLLLNRLSELSEPRRGSYLAGRLRDGLEHVRRKGTADTLDEELKYLADVDAARIHSSYALVRIVIWAIPILGFLGTVVGITLAIANLSPQQLESSLPEVTAGLGVAFDTTALGLALSMVLMFSQFLTDRAEHNLLAQVDVRATQELVGRFSPMGTGGDPQMVAVRRMADAVLQATERVVHRQAELWQATIEAAHTQWAQHSAATLHQIETALTKALNASLENHARHLSEAEHKIASRQREQVQQMQEALTRSAEAVRGQQAELVKQGEVLLKVVDATGQVTKLEDALNRNLSALSGAQNFEETLVSLSAAIHLLSARLGGAASSKNVDLHTNRSGTQAA